MHIICYTSMIHFQEQLLILWKQHPTEEEEIHFGAGLGQNLERPGKIQSENSLAGFS